MSDRSNTASDPGDPRIMAGTAWDELSDALRRARRLVLAEGVPDSPRDRARCSPYTETKPERGCTHE